ncbi:MAG: TonB-dependent receptor, partial [Pseudomonadota bacterium]|nr:TonB-dependent receptor [Pseudomonadota bacterium]
WTPDDISSLKLSWQQIGKYFTDERNNNTYSGHEVVNVRLAREIADGAFLSLSLINLFDEKYAKRADYAFGNARYCPGDARHFNIVLKKAFLLVCKRLSGCPCDG